MRALLWLSGLATVVLGAGIAWYLAPLSPGVLVLQFAFSPRVFGEVIHLWPAEHLLRFRKHLPADYLLAFCYGLFAYLLARQTTILSHSGAVARSFLTWALPIAAGCDWLENALHGWLTEAPRFGTTWPYWAAAGSAAAKWSLLLAWGLGIVFALWSRIDERN